MINTSIILVLILTFIINIIGTFAYAIRIVGVRTKRIAITSALFNIFILLSRLASNIQVPFLTKYIETHNNAYLLNICYYVLIAAGIASIIGAIFIPAFQRIFCKLVESFNIKRSIPKMLLHAFSGTGIVQFKEHLVLPSKNNITRFNLKKLPVTILIFNIIAVAFLTVATIAPIYAGALNPNLRATCITLTGILNAFAAFLLYIFIDPHLSMLTDDVVTNKYSEEDFRMCVVGMVVSKVIGTFIALPLLIPASYLVIFIAKVI